MKAIDEARAFVARNRIEGEGDYRSLGLNEWSVFERFKRELAAEIAPESSGWPLAVKELARVLKI